MGTKLKKKSLRFREEKSWEFMRIFTDEQYEKMFSAELMNEFSKIN